MVEKKTLSDLQKQVDNWISKYGGGYWDPLSMLAALIEESGELAKEINYQQGYKPKKSNEKEHKINEEVADVLFALICIANHFEIDLEKELKKTLHKYTTRDEKRFIE